MGAWQRILQAMWTQLGGTEPQLDELFALAVTL